MEELITSYGIDYQSLKSLLTTKNSLIAGSTALYLYLKQNHIEPTWEPNDIDIWVEDTDEIILQNGSYVQRGNMYLFANLLISSGYNLTREFEQKDHYEELIQKIKFILSFVHPNGKKVQIIVVTQNYLLDYIITHFDLSICITWWNAFTETVETFYPELTLKMQCVLMVSHNMYPDRLLKRIEKYTQRGFTITESPPPFKNKVDPRSSLSTTSLNDKTAFDIWNYDDVNCVDFLEESQWNILFYISGSFQAFRRDDLVEFMKKRSTLLPTIGYVYDTPHNQSITKNALDILSFSDYSIFELITQYTISHHHHTKTLHSLKCYTIAEWEMKTPGNEFIVPFEDFISPPPAPIIQQEHNDNVLDLVQLINQDLYPNGLPEEWNIQEIELVNLQNPPQLENNIEININNDPEEEEFQDILSLLLIQ